MIQFLIWHPIPSKLSALGHLNLPSFLLVSNYQLVRLHCSPSPPLLFFSKTSGSRIKTRNLLTAAAKKSLRCVSIIDFQKRTSTRYGYGLGRQVNIYVITWSQFLFFLLFHPLPPSMMAS